jgi:hypothetical protein
MMDLKPGDTIQLRKKHPCGSNGWEVLQIGVDFRIKCLGCQRQILIDRMILERKVKSVVPDSSPVSNDKG